MKITDILVKNRKIIYEIKGWFRTYILVAATRYDADEDKFYHSYTLYKKIIKDGCEEYHLDKLSKIKKILDNLFKTNRDRPEFLIFNTKYKLPAEMRCLYHLYSNNDNIFIYEKN